MQPIIWYSLRHPIKSKDSNFLSNGDEDGALQAL